jgi:hypothetical protein
MTMFIILFLSLSALFLALDFLAKWQKKKISEKEGGKLSYTSFMTGPIVAFLISIIVVILIKQSGN